MSEQNENNVPALAWTKLYHPSGALVSLPLHDTDEWAYEGYMRNVDNAIKAGFLVDQPVSQKQADAKAQEALGKTRPQQEIGGILLTETNGRSGPGYRAFFYSVNEAAKHPVISKYLNVKADFDDFEKHTGIRLADAPLFDGTSGPERGKSPRADAKIIKVNPPIWVTLTPNPQWDEAEYNAVQEHNRNAAATGQPTKVYKVAKRLFSHWGGGEGQTAYADRQQGDQHDGQEQLTAYDVALQKMENAQTMADVDGVNAYIKSQWAKIDKASQDDLRQRRDALVERIKENESIPF